MKKLTELTEKEFNTLKEGGLLKDFYPEAPEDFKDVSGNRPQPKPASAIDVQSLIDLTESIMQDLEERGYAKDSAYWCYEGLMNAIYGNDVWKWINSRS